MGRVLELSGTAANVEMAAYVYDYICHFIEGQWRLFNGGKGHGLRRKVDFAVGVLDGFRRKLEPAKTARLNPTQARALVSLKDPMLEKYLKYKYPHTKSFRRQGVGQDPEILRAGIAAGETLVIAKGVTETGRGRQVDRLVGPDLCLCLVQSTSEARLFPDSSVYTKWKNLKREFS